MNLVNQADSRFIDRDLSDLAFIERVLEEAENERVPVLERVRFLAITGMLLDEFYRVRVAGLRDLLRTQIPLRPGESGKLQSQLAAVDARSNELLARQDSCWGMLRRSMRSAGITLAAEEDVTREDRAWLARYFETEIRPRLEPTFIEGPDKLPFVKDGDIVLVADLHGVSDDRTARGVLILPRDMPRFVVLPGATPRFLPLENAMALFTDSLFAGQRVRAMGLARIIREGDLKLADDDDNPLTLVSHAVEARDRAAVIRLKVDAQMPETMRRDLAMAFGVVDSAEIERLTATNRPVTASEFVAVDNLLGLADTIELPRGFSRKKASELTFAPLGRKKPPFWNDYAGDLFSAISDKDRLLHYPFDDFHVFTEFLQQAARDESVVSIQQTLYRSGYNSRIVKALARAAKLGKRVTVVIELKAREEERENIRLAKRLEAAGCTIHYGMPRIKVHAKLLIVERRERGRLRRYVNVSTGNYYARTAKSYTDLSVLTVNEAIAADAQKLFRYTMGGPPPSALSHLSIAPLGLRSKVTSLVEREIAHAREGRPAAIWIKLNHISDANLIDHLYRASQAGVDVEIIVRGICRLRPGVIGMSERIRVKSVVGRFLEHSRVLCFANGAGLPADDAEAFITSADFMPHKLDDRVESLCPLLDPDVRMQALQIVSDYLRDTAQSWQLDGDGNWKRLADKGFDVQRALLP